MHLNVSVMKQSPPKDIRFFWMKRSKKAGQKQDLTLQWVLGFTKTARKHVLGETKILFWKCR